jgi:hypothetical protein
MDELRDDRVAHLAVETGVPPSGPIRSAVRSPSASTASTAASSRSASAPRSKE